MHLVLAGDHYSIKMSLQLDHLQKVVHRRHHLDFDDQDLKPK